MILLQRISPEYFIKEVTIKVSDEASTHELAEAMRLFMIALGYDTQQCFDAIPDPDAEEDDAFDDVWGLNNESKESKKFDYDINDLSPYSIL